MPATQWAIFEFKGSKGKQSTASAAGFGFAEPETIFGLAFGASRVH